MNPHNSDGPQRFCHVFGRTLYRVLGVGPVGAALLLILAAGMPAPAAAVPEPRARPLQQQTDPPAEEEQEQLEEQPAPETASGPPRFTEEVVVVGTRATPRSILESAAPIDAIRPEDLLSQGPPSIYERLRTLVPSFAVNIQPISDAATLVRPAMLRNLAPNHTLILINGKRRHRSAVIDWNGGNGVSFGSQGPDLAAIPAIALRRVEVLPTARPRSTARTPSPGS